MRRCESEAVEERHGLTLHGIRHGASCLQTRSKPDKLELLRRSGEPDTVGSNTIDDGAALLFVAPLRPQTECDRRMQTCEAMQKMQMQSWKQKEWRLQKKSVQQKPRLRSAKSACRTRGCGDPLREHTNTAQRKRKC